MIATKLKNRLNSRYSNRFSKFSSLFGNMVGDVRESMTKILDFQTRGKKVQRKRFNF